MMHVDLKCLHGRLFPDVWTLIFSFTEIWIHICQCFLLIKNRLRVHIFQANFQTNVKIII